MPDDSGVWPLVTSTRDNCLGGECPRYKDCFVMEARKQALAADVVVVNHHLFFADLMLKDEGITELLPACNTVIFDEAHQLPDTATLFFGQSVSTAQLIELARDTRVEAAVVCQGLRCAYRTLRRRSSVQRAICGCRCAKRTSRQTANALDQRAEFQQALDRVSEKLTALTALLEFQADRSEGLANCLRRAEELSQPHRTVARGLPTTEMVRWVEVFHASVQLNATPLSIAEIVRSQLTASPRAWVFTSATLSVKGDFAHYQSQMGLEAAQHGDMGQSVRL